MDIELTYNTEDIKSLVLKDAKSQYKGKDAKIRSIRPDGSVIVAIVPAERFQGKD